MITRFTCDRCGKCCETHRVPITGHDLLRLNEAGRPAAESVEFLAPHQVDMTGEPESFAWLREGRRLLVLRHRPTERGSACVFLTKRGCSIHSDRPAACRAYPFDRPENSNVVGLHPESVCPDETGVRLPLQSGFAEDEAQKWSQAVQNRDAEAHDYAAWLLKWNQRQKTRARLGKALLSAPELLSALQRSSGDAS